MEKTNDKKMPYGVLNADCLEAMKKLPDNFIDAVVTDPPYGLSFMGKDWDYGVPGVAFWKEALRITKPGGHIVAFGGSRTYHRLTCAIEDAGWEIRDCLGWLYSSGFPKSMDISKAIDKKLGAKRVERGGVGEHNGTIDFGMKNRCPKCGKPYFSANPCVCPRDDLIPITEEAKKWSGWGTCLKPAFEPIVLARKPLEGTVVENVMKHGVGGLNIDECRVPSDESVVVHSPAKKTLYDSGHENMGTWVDNRGRFPANIIHDGSDEVLEVFPDNVKGGTWNTTKGARHFNNNGEKTDFENHGADTSTGSAARFFYCAKASKKEKGKDNPHPTVKPIKLMEYLVKLIAPKGSTVLDPFMGSGTTGVAAMNLGRRFIGIEKEPEYFAVAKKRIEEAFLKSKNDV